MEVVPVPRFALFSPIALLTLSVLAATTIQAQDFRAKLTVTVTDPSGLAIPKATLELTSVSTTEMLPATTNDTGVYTYLFLTPGNYSLKATAPGFKVAVRSGIALQSYQASGVDLKLEVGGVTDSVTVADEGVLLQTETADGLPGPIIGAATMQGGW